MSTYQNGGMCPLLVFSHVCLSSENIFDEDGEEIFLDAFIGTDKRCRNVLYGKIEAYRPIL